MLQRVTATHRRYMPGISTLLLGQPGVGFPPWTLLPNICSPACFLPLSPNLTAYAWLDRWETNLIQVLGKRFFSLSLPHPFLFRVITISGKLASLGRDYWLTDSVLLKGLLKCTRVTENVPVPLLQVSNSPTANSINSCRMQWILFSDI